MERLLRFLNDQRELGAPDDELGRMVDAILAETKASDSGLLDENELESVQAATGRPDQKMDTAQDLNGAETLFAAKRNKKRGR